MRHTSRRFAGLALPFVMVLSMTATARAVLLNVKVDAVFDAAGNPLADPLAISPDGKLAFIPDGGAVTFGVYIDLTGAAPPPGFASVNGLSAYTVSLLTGATPDHWQGYVIPAPINSPGRERYGVTVDASAYTYSLVGSTPYFGVSDTLGVLTGSLALKPDETQVYPLNNFTILGPPDLYDLASFGSAGPQSPYVVADDVGTDYIAVGGVQGSKVTKKTAGGANKAWVPGLATETGVINIPTGGAYGNGAYKGPMIVAQMTFTAIPRGQEPGARSVQVNAFFTDDLFTQGGAEVANLTSASNNTNSVNGEFVRSDTYESAIGAPVMVIVGGILFGRATATIVLQGLPDGSSTSVAFGRVISGSTPKQDLTLQDTVNAAMYNATLAGKALVAHGSGATPGNANISNQSFSGSSNDTLSVGLDTTTNGAWNSGNTISIHNVYNASDNDDTVTVTGTVVGNRVVTASSVDLGVLRVSAPATQATILSTLSGDDNHATRVTVANAGPDANGISVTGGSNPTFNDNSVTDTRLVGGTFSSIGTKSGTLTLITTAEGLAGESPVNPTVNYTAQVYSGKAEWNLSGGGSWGTHGNWKDTQSSALGGAPGVSGVGGDTATFGNASGSSAVTVNLDGADPTVSMLTFNNTSGGSYTVAQGSGGTLTLSTDSGSAAVNVIGGSHEIAAPMTLGGNTDVTVSNTPNALTVSGAIGGPGGLTKIGSGPLTLSGSNTYNGTTTVNAGTLKLGSPSALGSTAGNTVVNTLAVVDLNGQAVGNEAVSINATGIGNSGALSNSNSATTASLSGALTLGSASSIGGGGSVTLTGPIWSNFDLTKVGSSTLTLVGPQNWGGGATLQVGGSSGGVLNMGSNPGRQATSSGVAQAPLNLAVRTANTADFSVLNLNKWDPSWTEPGAKYANTYVVSSATVNTVSESTGKIVLKQGNPNPAGTVSGGDIPPGANNSVLLQVYTAGTAPGADPTTNHAAMESLWSQIETGFYNVGGNNGITTNAPGASPSGTQRLAMLVRTDAKGAKYLGVIKDLAGDVNGDFQVNINDVVKMAQHLDQPAANFGWGKFTWWEGDGWSQISNAIQMHRFSGKCMAASNAIRRRTLLRMNALRRYAPELPVSGGFSRVAIEI